MEITPEQAEALAEQVLDAGYPFPAEHGWWREQAQALARFVRGQAEAATAEYRRGFCDGVRAYAYTSSESWAENGVQYVGTNGRTLREALENVEETYNYSPGQTRIAAE